MHISEGWCWKPPLILIWPPLTHPSGSWHTCLQQRLFSTCWKGLASIYDVVHCSSRLSSPNLSMGGIVAFPWKRVDIVPVWVCLRKRPQIHQCFKETTFKCNQACDTNCALAWFTIKLTCLKQTHFIVEKKFIAIRLRWGFKKNSTQCARTFYPTHMYIRVDWSCRGFGS